MKNSSVMQHAFSRVPKVSLPRSIFNRSHGYKTTFDTDYLVPFLVDEALPGDTFNCNASILIRLNSPTIKPIMDNLWVDTFFFFVPNRLLWSNFKKFMGEQDNPADSISYTVPQVTGPNVASSGIPIGSLFDFMGLPVGPLSGGGATTGITFNNLHGRAYNQIWNEWFRDQNLQNAVTKDLGDGPDTFSNYNLLKRGKRHDYFTSALPWPLKGGTEVQIPLGTSATVKTSASNLYTGSNTAANWLQSNGAGAVGNKALMMGSPNSIYETTTAVTGSGNGFYPANLYADLSTATAATLNALRQSITLQQFLERDARGGTRYPELIVSHFGVTNPDSRVQRPELLSTNSQRLNISPVSATTNVNALSGTGENIYVGQLAGIGTASQFTGFHKSFTEHGVIMGLINVRADLTYQQGMDRMWSRRTRYDYYWPTFANLGEQAILNREIYANLQDGTASNQKDGVFGYIPRYDEYRFKNSKITGTLRSYNGNTLYATSLNIWHLSEAFSSQPTLGSTFIQSAVPLDRVIAVPTQDHFILDTYFDYKCARVMPVFGVPGLNKL